MEREPGEPGEPGGSRRRREGSRSADREAPHDILAAEAFAMGEGDPGLHREPAHDVLAAEAFAMPAADRGSRHTPPDEHTGDTAPHDVLSAEEYAMPAGSHRAIPPDAPGGSARSRRWAGLLKVVVGLIAVRTVVRAIGRRRRGR